MEDQIKKVFILGKQRSGTTGLANHLCEHNNVEGIQSPIHQGIHESAFFSHVYGRYGSLKRKTNYVELLSVFLSSDYYKLSDVSAEYLESLWPVTYTEFFEKFMDRHTKNNGSNIWVEKTPPHTKISRFLARVYPHAYFVGIVRNLRDVIKSRLAYESETCKRITGKRNRAISIVNMARSWFVYKECIVNLKQKYPDRVYYVEYDKLDKEKSKVLEEICQFLGVNFDPTMKSYYFEKNTSFDSHKRRKISQSESLLLLLFNFLFYIIYSILPVNPQQYPDNSCGCFDLPNWFFKSYQIDN